MAENAQSSGQKESFVDKLFHHKHHEDGNKQGGGYSQPSTMNKSQNKESEIDKLEDDVTKDKEEFKGYMKEDEKLEKEGQTYGAMKYLRRTSDILPSEYEDTAH